MKPIVIIGSGIAGYSLIKALRALDNQIPLILITKDKGDYYYKPMLSNALSNKQTADSLVWMSGEEMAHQYSFELLSNYTVNAVDADLQRVNTTEKEIPYSQLVFACGSTPRNPSIKAPQVFAVNHLEDYRQFLKAINNKKHITILGSGFIGCEFANDLTAAGFQVSIISLDNYPLQRMIPETIGKNLKHQLTSIGVDWHLSAQIMSINPKKTGLELQISDGTNITTDVVLSAIGLLPNIVVARNSGIHVNRGIVVDAHLKTNLPNIYSLGECAEINGQIWPFVIPIRQESQALAKTLLGSPTALSLKNLLITVKTPIYPISFCGDLNNKEYQAQIHQDETGIKGIFTDAERKCKAFILTKQQVLNAATLLKEMIT